MLLSLKTGVFVRYAILMSVKYMQRGMFYFFNSFGLKRYMLL